MIHGTCIRHLWLAYVRLFWSLVLDDRMPFPLYVLRMLVVNIPRVWYIYPPSLVKQFFCRKGILWEQRYVQECIVLNGWLGMNQCLRFRGYVVLWVGVLWDGKELRRCSILRVVGGAGCSIMGGRDREWRRAAIRGTFPIVYIVFGSGWVEGRGDRSGCETVLEYCMSRIGQRVPRFEGWLVTKLKAFESINYTEVQE